MAAHPLRRFGHPCNRRQCRPAIAQRRAVAILKLVPAVVILRYVPYIGEAGILQYGAVPSDTLEGGKAVPGTGLIENAAVIGGVVNHHHTAASSRWWIAVAAVSSMQFTTTRTIIVNQLSTVEH